MYGKWLKWGGNQEAQRQADEAYRKMLYGKKAAKKEPLPQRKKRTHHKRHRAMDDATREYVNFVRSERGLPLVQQELFSSEEYKPQRNVVTGDLYVPSNSDEAPF